MIEDKYYTPEIEEFHVGFEYESLEIGSQTKFNKDVVTDNHLYGDYDQSTLLSELYFHPERARVKYLDKEDIESLGFKFKEGTESSYVKDNITMHVYYAKRWNTKNDTITIFKRDLIRAVGKTIIFSGTIKNKSELFKLLKQLGI